MAWFLVQTKVQSETMAKYQLERQDYSVYLPMLNDLPLFPGYLFIQIQDEQSFKPIGSTIGVQKIVEFGAGPTHVPSHVVVGLKSMVFEDVEKYPINSSVRIKNGPWAHREALVKCRKGDRIIVLMSIMQRESEIEFPIKSIEAA